MSVEANKQLISALIDEVWNEHDPAAVARFFGPGLREEIAEHPQQSSIRIRIYRVKDGKVVETWAMQDRLALLQQVGAIAEPVAVNWAGGASPDPERSA
jgi:predicted SnoaL-like aldol condensation-catalyzing enzyme